jgi:ABC-type ATPase involved in cell division
MKRQLVRILVAASIVTFCLAIMPGCGNLNPAQQQAVANTIAAVGVAGGEVVLALPPSGNLTPQQQQAIADGLTKVAAAGGQIVSSGSKTNTSGK